MKTEAPATYEEAGALLSACARQGSPVRFIGGSTKLAWGNAVPAPQLELSTTELADVVEHNTGDFTAVVQAGAPFAAAQKVFAGADQMFALDPPAVEDGATFGGIVASGDSGPLRHRFNAVRDLLLGITVALSDGTVARAGSRVIKNVAGYDLAKLFSGSFGTLGLICDVTIRLHPLPPDTATAVGRTSDPAVLGRGALAAAHARIETNCLDVAWASGEGRVLARFGGADPKGQAEAALRVLDESGLDRELVEEDAALWDEQRAGQRSAGGTVVKVSGRAAELERTVAAVDETGGSLVGRAGLGLSWVSYVDAGAPGQAVAVEALRRALHPWPCVVQDAPQEVRSAIDVWGRRDGPEIALMRRVKERLDPAGVCNPGLFVGGI